MTMASTRIPRPPRFLVRLVLWIAPPVMVMCVIVGVLAAARWNEYATAARMFCLAGSQAGGWMYALKLCRSGRG